MFPGKSDGQNLSPIQFFRNAHLSRQAACMPCQQYCAAAREEHTKLTRYSGEAKQEKTGRRGIVGGERESLTSGYLASKLKYER